MLSNSTTIKDIRKLFSQDDLVGAEKQERDELDVKINRYTNSKGAGSYLQKIIEETTNNDEAKGLSYINTFDFLFYLILADGSNEKRHEEYIKIRNVKKETIYQNIRYYIFKNDPRDISLKKLICYECKEDQTLDQFMKDLEEKEIFKETDSPSLDKSQILAIEICIHMLCSPLPDRYLARNGEHWCREERQLALFLYNVLLQKKRKLDVKDDNPIYKGVNEIFDVRSFNDIEIDELYYEASIIRDYFNHLIGYQREEFNNDLLSFCFSDLLNDVKTKEEKDVQQSILDLVRQYKYADKKRENEEKSLIGGMESLKEIINHNEEPLFKFLEDEAKKARLFIATKMANATPDILVIYHHKDEENTKRTKIIECKNESGVGIYKDGNGGIINQKLLQELIMVFLFGPRKDIPEPWKVNGEQNPIDYYGSKEKEKYIFCNNLLKNAKTPGYFNKYEDPKKHIYNMGVIEVDFDKEKYEKKKTNETIILIKSEDLINHEYY